MCVVNLGGGEEGVERVVTGNEESGKVGEELTTVVEEDEEEVDEADAADDVDLGDTYAEK